MTWRELASLAFGKTMPTEDLNNLAEALKEGYLLALSASAFPINGIDYLFEGAIAKPLHDVLREINLRGGPL